MKFTLNRARVFAWKGLKGWVYSSKEDFENASVAYFEVTESHGKVKTTRSDRVYFVIDGEGEFIIDEEIISVKESDVVIVPKNTPYDYKVKKHHILKLFLVHIPAYDPEAEVKLG